jgi:hypothetical protein
MITISSDHTFICNQLLHTINFKIKHFNLFFLLYRTSQENVLKLWNAMQPPILEKDFFPTKCLKIVECNATTCLKKMVFCSDISQRQLLQNILLLNFATILYFFNDICRSHKLFFL